MRIKTICVYVILSCAFPCKSAFLLSVRGDRLKMENGTYTAELTMKGGSGKAHIESPVMFTVEDDSVNVTLVWSSENYDYMEFEGKSYYPVNESGYSEFIIADIPFDTEITVLAETLAMGNPHTIEYTLCIDSSTIEKVNEENNMTFPIIFICAAFVIALSAIIKIITKRKKINETKK